MDKSPVAGRSSCHFGTARIRRLWPALCRWAGGGVVIVEEAPPALRIELIPAQPGPEQAWVPGRWAWRVTPKRYAWVPGHYRVIRHPHHHAWVPGQWKQGPRGWFYVRGNWR